MAEGRCGTDGKRCRMADETVALIGGRLMPNTVVACGRGGGWCRRWNGTYGAGVETYTGGMYGAGNTAGWGAKTVTAGCLL